MAAHCRAIVANLTKDKCNKHMIYSGNDGLTVGGLGLTCGHNNSLASINSLVGGGQR